MLLNHRYIDIMTAVGSLLAFSYFWGVASFQHYLPNANIYLSTIVSLIVAVAVVIYCYKSRFGSILSFGSLLWIVFFCLILVQPLFNSIVYLDSLVFPIGGMLIAVLLSLLIAQLTIDNKKLLVNFMAIAILGAGAFTVFTQFAQLMQWDFLVGKILFRTGGGRLIGNIAQVNQAVFVSSLAIASVFYFIYQPVLAIKKQVYFIAAFFILFWLGMGVGFSASRGGMLLAIGAMITPALFYKASLKQRILYPILLSPAIVFGYLFGTQLMNRLLQSDMSAVGRMVGENTLYLRKNLLEQAWLAFVDSPLTGQGWGNLQKFGLDHANELAWFTTANHSHNFIAQIASELGILGLLILVGFAYLLIKNLRFNHENYLAFSYSVLMLVGMYSLSEYPLWYMRFFVLTVFFIAIIDSSKLSLLVKRKIELRPIVGIFAVLLVLGSSYYIVQYQQYVKTSYIVYSDKPYEEKIQSYNELPNVFGYSRFKDLMLYSILPIEEDNVYQQIELAERVSSKYLVGGLLLKQANLYAIVDRQEDADQMYINACRLGYIKDFVEDGCNQVIVGLQANAEDSEYYQAYLDRFALWYEKTYQKKLPNMLE